MRLTATGERTPTLADAALGEVRRVDTVLGDDALAQRLQDLGLLPGTEVEAIARAPFGDPLLFRLRGFRLALRRDEAARVRTAPVAPTAATSAAPPGPEGAA